MLSVEEKEAANFLLAQRPNVLIAVLWKILRVMSIKSIRLYNAKDAGDAGLINITKSTADKKI